MAPSPKTGDEKLGRRIAGRRDELGLSRRQLAEVTGLSYAYVSQIETGYRFPTAKNQVLLAKALGVSLDELFGIEGEAPPAQRPAEASPGGDGVVHVLGLTRALAAPAEESYRRGRPTIDEVVERAAQEIEVLPASVRLEALSRVQERILTTVAEEWARERR